MIEKMIEINISYNNKSKLFNCYSEFINEPLNSFSFKKFGDIFLILSESEFLYMSEGLFLSMGRYKLDNDIEYYINVMLHNDCDGFVGRINMDSLLLCATQEVDMANKLKPLLRLKEMQLKKEDIAYCLKNMSNNCFEHFTSEDNAFYVSKIMISKFVESSIEMIGEDYLFNYVDMMQFSKFAASIHDVKLMLKCLNFIGDTDPSTSLVNYVFNVHNKEVDLAFKTWFALRTVKKDKEIISINHLRI